MVTPGGVASRRRSSRAGAVTREVVSPTRGPHPGGGRPGREARPELSALAGGASRGRSLWAGTGVPPRRSAALQPNMNRDALTGCGRHLTTLSSPALHVPLATGLGPALPRTRKQEVGVRAACASGSMRGGIDCERRRAGPI